MRLSQFIASSGYLLLPSVLREPSLGTRSRMEFTVPNFTLPAMCHIVCQLVATGISGIDVNSPGANQLPQQEQLQTFPEGYVAYHDVGFAYKVYNETVTWAEAWKRCTREGAQLALIDSAKKVEYVTQQKQNTMNLAHVGITRVFDGATWTAVSTGLPLSSLPWKIGEPGGSTNCVQIHFPENGLGIWGCQGENNYVCELPIHQKSELTAN